MTDRDRVEKGPWAVRHDGKDVYLDSNDFTHDVCLIVRGDLGDRSGDYRRAYAEALCKVLNAATPISF